MVDSPAPLSTHLANFTPGNHAGGNTTQHFRDYMVSAFPVVFNVQNYGAIGDDATDDTAAIHAAYAACAAAGAGTVFFPPGTYKVTDVACFMTSPHVSLVGCGQYVSIIKQYTAGKPIIHFNTALVWGLEVAYLGLVYPSSQTNPDSVAILSGIAGGANGGIFHLLFHDLMTKFAYRVFGETADDGQQTAWDCHFQDITAFQTTNALVYMVPAVTIGVPNVSFRNFVGDNTGSEAVRPTGAAFSFSAVEVRLENLDLEGWYNEILVSTGGRPVYVGSAHIEHHVVDNSQCKLFYVANGPATLSSMTIAAESASGNDGTLELVVAGLNGLVSLRDCIVDITDNGSASTRNLAAADTGGSVTVTNCTDVSEFFAAPTRFSTVGLTIQDGVAAPAAVVGGAQIYVDTSDGDLKVIFGDGTVKTIVVDT